MTRWLAPALAVAVGGLLAAGLGGPLQVAYPLAVLAVGMAIERRSVPGYVSFVIWVWALTPFVRRVADLQSGWHEPSLILLAPYLVTAAPPAWLLARSLLASLREPPSLAGRGMFVLSGLGILAGVPMGFATAPTSAVVETLNWAVPVAFGAYLAAWRTEVARIERTVVRTCFQASVLVGVYAVYQFMRAPVWDIEWMRSVEADSFGLPREFELRTFSTFHSPGVLGYFAVVPVAVWIAHPRWATSPAAALAVVALALSQVRAAWLAVALSMAFAIPVLSGRDRLRLAVIAAIGMIVAAPFVLPIEISDATLDRVATLTNLGNDESALSRFEGHTLLIDVLNRHPFGLGVGVSDRRVEQLIGSRDSIVVSTLVQFGLVGALAYAVGLGLLIVRIASYYRRAQTYDALGLACAGLGLLSAIFFGTVTAGPPGIFIWIVGGLAAARVAARADAGARARTAPLSAPTRPAWPAPHAVRHAE